MSLSELAAALSLAADGAVYEREAPAGLTRYVVYSQYNYQTVPGDDAAAARFPRVQLDVCWQAPHDGLLDDVLSVLDYWRQPCDSQDSAWDDERQLFRAVVQLTLV